MDYDEYDSFIASLILEMLWDELLFDWQNVSTCDAMEIIE